MIILFGIKHCGKSTIGKKLSLALGEVFIDVDTVIENIAGKSCRDLYRQDGKEAFMKAEAKACKEIAENPLYKNAVVATGGGICDNQEALDFLTTGKSGQETKLFYVDIEEDIAFKRIQHNMEKTGSWPGWIPKDVYDDLEAIKGLFHNFYTERTKKYKSFCSVVVPVENGDSEKASDFIMESLKLV